MNSSLHSSDADRIDEEAALWAARLRSGAMTAAEREQLAAWQERAPAHRAALGRYRGLCANLDLHYGGELETERRAIQRVYWQWAASALGAAAAVVVLFALFWSRPESYVTKVAERQIAALEDGTRVELNADTEVRVAFGRAERRVRLVRGEALFTVAQNPARPFVVETPAGTVRVTGTIFNVRAVPAGAGGLARDPGLEVTVLEGHVQVKPAAANDGAALTAGDQVAATSGGLSKVTLPGDRVQDVVAWRRGEAVFQDTPLRDVVAHFAPYHSGSITIDPDIADLRLGGRFSLNDVDGALEAIQRVLPVRVQRGAAGDITLRASVRR